MFPRKDTTFKPEQSSRPLASFFHLPDTNIMLLAVLIIRVIIEFRLAACSKG
jgi:hypothetical protein